MTDKELLDFEQRQLAEVLANEIVDCADTINYAYELIWLRQQVSELEAALSDAKDSVVSWVADNEKMISSMEDELAAANRGAERNAIINRELAQELAALKQGQGEPVAWMTEDGMRVATAETKESAMANPSKSAFCIPLYTSAPTIPAEGEPEIRWVYRGEGEKVHVAGRPTTEDVAQYLGDPTIPEGWQLVPVEPTPEMVKAGRDLPVADTGDDDVDAPQDYINVYRAMLSAAPKPKEMSERERLMLTGDEPRVVAETQGATVWARKWGAKDWWPIVNVELDCGRITIDVCGLGEVWDLGECAQLRMGNDEFVENDDIYTALASCVGCWRIDRAKEPSE